MPRPAEFDRDEALDRAIRVFARHGYEAASTSDLIESMGIGRQSLYGAFGDKRRLFLAALRRYGDASMREMRAALEAAPSAAEALGDAVLVGIGGCDDLETGCLGLGSIVEFSRTDPDINALNDAGAEQLAEVFAARIRQGVADGELDPGLDPAAAARLLLVLRSGLKVSARGGADRAELRDAARLALRGLISPAR